MCWGKQYKYVQFIFRETDRAATEKLTIKEQLQKLEPNLPRASEKSELLVDNALENQLSPSEPVGGVGKV